MLHLGKHFWTRGPWHFLPDVQIQHMQHDTYHDDQRLARLRHGRLLHGACPHICCQVLTFLLLRVCMRSHDHVFKVAEEVSREGRPVHGDKALPFMASPLTEAASKHAHVLEDELFNIADAPGLLCKSMQAPKAGL